MGRIGHIGNWRGSASESISSMSEWDETVIGKDDALLATPFMVEMLRQMRAVDRYGIWDQAGDHEILDPFIMTRRRKRNIPVVGDPDEDVLARVSAWYNGLAVAIERESGRMAVPVVHLSHEGFGRALITVGRLIVVDNTLRDIHRFGFCSLESMVADADKIIAKAAQLIAEHGDVADL